jgi:hypothetical protein
MAFWHVASIDACGALSAARVNPRLYGGWLQRLFILTGTTGGTFMAGETAVFQARA